LRRSNVEACATWLFPQSLCLASPAMIPLGIFLAPFPQNDNIPCALLERVCKLAA
jgi:hypothetical protein